MSSSYELVTLDGKQFDLSLKGIDPFIYSVHDGLIAYSTERGVQYFTDRKNPEIFIAKVDQSGSVEEIASFILDDFATLSTTLEIRGFSRDNSYFAFFINLNDGSKERYLKVMDIRDNTFFTIQFPNTDADLSIKPIRFFWIDENTLLMTTESSTSDETRISTWTYSIN
ncbi:hypothetical protein L3i20_v219200 [Paenibacillus sp. L3-i20]|nr:hypothetical protein L3i20_v219200 [Paenibacillus sp. L3-i20]